MNWFILKKTSDLRDLSQFPNLEELICDNNYIADESQFPKLNNLKIFSCNKNRVSARESWSQAEMLADLAFSSWRRSRTCTSSSTR